MRTLLQGRCKVIGKSVTIDMGPDQSDVSFTIGAAACKRWETFTAGKGPLVIEVPRPEVDDDLPRTHLRDIRMSALIRTAGCRQAAVCVSRHLRALLLASRFYQTENR